ncbi:autotransporter outer membrane beta-barrel domain-containing protein [Alcaligenes sp. Lyrl_28]|uniref:autotransporter outer membrane beta-barrel domain-containing protein n=1 Tax=Alcaligenes sp. Lyrl_28 TaxID=3110924 RepID=UPI003F7C7856
MKSLPTGTHHKRLTIACLLAMSPLGSYAQGLSVTDGTLHVLAPDTHIDTSGVGTAGIGVLVRNSGSAVDGSGLTITTSGQGAAGVKLETGGKIRITGGSIQTTTNLGTSSSAAYGVWVTGKGLADLRETSVTTSGDFAYGLYAFTAPAQDQTGIIAQNVNVKTLGNSAHGAVAASNGAMELTGVNISTGGSGARGVSAQRGIIKMTDSNVITTGQNAPGMMAVGDGSGVGSQVSLENTTIKTQGSQSRGVVVDTASTFSMKGGSIETTALDGTASLSAYGTWVTGGSLAQFESAVVKTQGVSAYGIFSTYAPTVSDKSISANQTSVETSGTNAHGLFAHLKSIISFDGGTLETSGDNAVGARAEAGGGLSIKDSEIRTSGFNAAGLMATANATGVKANATADGVHILTQGVNSDGVVAFQQGSTVALTGGMIETRGDKSYGLSAEATGVVNTMGTKVSTSGNTAYGARAFFTAEINVNDSVIETHGAGSSGLYSNGSSTINANSSLVSTGGAGSAGVELLSKGTVILDHSTVETSGAGSHGILGRFSASGDSNTFRMTDSAVRATGSAMKVAAGSLEAFLTRSSLVGVNGVAIDAQGHLDLVAQDQSYISGAAVKDPANGVSRLTLSDGSRWDMTGDSSLTSLNNLASHVAFSAPVDGAAATQYKELRVGSYVGAGGSIALNTWLAGSESASDKLIIDGGRASGSTSLTVTNSGGGGALTSGDGIQVVEVVNGGSTESGAFSLAGRVAAGAYEYRLYRGGSVDKDSWYLRSASVEKPVDPDRPVSPEKPVDPDRPVSPEKPVDPDRPVSPEKPVDPDRPVSPEKPGRPEYRVEVPLNMAIPSIANKFGVAMLGTYHDRNGEDYASRQFEDRNASWSRVIGEIGKSGKSGYDSFAVQGPAFTYDVAGVQVGQDLYRTQNSAGTRDIAGIYFGAATISADVKGAEAGKAGRSSMNGFSLGGYWTRKGQGGEYVDGVLQGTYYHDVKANSTGGERSTTTGYGAVASIEVGYPIALGARWSLEPQAQFLYQHISLNDTSDNYGRIQFGDTNAGYARAGARLVYGVNDRSDEQVTYWARANLWQKIGADSRTTFTSLDGKNPVSMNTELGNTWAQIGLGVSGKLSKRISVFASGDYNRSLDSLGGHGVTGRLGVRVLW